MAAIPIVDIRDRNIGFISAIVLLALIIVYLLLTTYQIADPPPQEFVMKMEAPISEMEFKNLKVEGGSSGGGTPSDAPIDDPKPVVEKILTQKTNPTHKTTSGEGKTTNTDKSDHPSQGPQKSDNPFGSNGKDGKNGGGSGGPFGDDKGDGGKGGGEGDKQGGGGVRTRLNDPEVDHIETNVNIVVYLKLTVNENGTVISAVSTSKTTTTDQRIISQVIAAVKNTVKYSKDPGAGMVTQFLTVRINAT